MTRWWLREHVRQLFGKKFLGLWRQQKHLNLTLAGARRALGVTR
jgi:hypothetical protein